MFSSFRSKAIERGSWQVSARLAYLAAAAAAYMIGINKATCHNAQYETPAFRKELLVHIINSLFLCELPQKQHATFQGARTTISAGSFLIFPNSGCEYQSKGMTFAGNLSYLRKTEKRKEKKEKCKEKPMRCSAEARKAPATSRRRRHRPQAPNAAFSSQAIFNRRRLFTADHARYGVIRSTARPSPLWHLHHIT